MLMSDPGPVGNGSTGFFGGPLGCSQGLARVRCSLLRPALRQRPAAAYWAGQGKAMLACAGSFCPVRNAAHMI